MRLRTHACLCACLVLGACDPQGADGQLPPTATATPESEPAPERAPAKPAQDPSAGAALRGDPTARELEILQVESAVPSDDLLLDLPGSSGLRADAEADRIAEGGRSVGTPQRGRISNAVPLPPRPHLYTRRNPRRAFGSTHTIRTIQTALSSLRSEKGVWNEVMIGDISLPGGGPISPHVSHQSGRDIDIRLLLAPGVDRQTVPIDPKTVDWDATWTMVHSFLETGAVKVLFLDFDRQARLHAAALRAGVHPTQVERWFQWPRRGGPGLIRHEAGHRAHVHIRLVCGHDEPHCRRS